MKRISILTVAFVVFIFSFSGAAVAQQITVEVPPKSIKEVAPRQKVRPLKPSVAVNPVIGTTKSAKPDLVVSRINFSPGGPKENEEVTIWVFVKNNGNALAAASGLRVQVGGESVINAPVAQVPALDPGREWRYERKITFPTATTYWVTATADALGAVTESYEGNNITKKTITVKTGLRPDLVISQINHSPASPFNNEEVTIWVFVKNTGQAWSTPCRLQVAVGGESVINAPVAQVPALDPGREWRYERKITLPGFNKYWVKATVDTLHTVTESKEGNNTKKKLITVKAESKPDPSTYLPNLGVMGGTRIGGKTWQDLSTTAVTLTANDVYVLDTGRVQIHLKYKYREYNGKPVNTSFKNRVYFNNQLVNEEVVPSMAPSEIREKTVVWDIANPNFNQQVQLRIVIDADHNVPDSNPNNNENITTITFSGI